MKDKESKNDKIHRCVQYYKNGKTDVFLLAGMLKIHPRTLYKWQKTELWKSLLPNGNFKIPCRRKNLITFKLLKERYLNMKDVPPHNRIGILLKDPKITVKKRTLFYWQKLWKEEFKNLRFK